MMDMLQSGNELQVTIRNGFDFTMAHRLLTVCSAVDRAQHDLQIEVRIDSGARCNSCVIGALLLLSELVPGRLRINLRDCSPQVIQLFLSDPLKPHFDGMLQNLPVSTNRSAP